MKTSKLKPEEFAAELRQWIASDGEALVDLYFLHSGGGGTLYLLMSPGDVEGLLQLARTRPRTATLTAFHGRCYPLRGLVDEAFVERARSAWTPGRWYDIVDLKPFPERLESLGCANTREELDADLSELLANRRGQMTAFGENPFDHEQDFLERYGVEAIETTVEPDSRPPGSQ